MHIRTIRLRQFRAHEKTEIEFGTGINVFCGPNGAGKTNILEAVHYICMSKSFIATSDRHALRESNQHFEIEGEFRSNGEKRVPIRLFYSGDTGKSAFVNGSSLERLLEMVGLVPVVVCSPLDLAITHGPPEERRRFVNNILCQASPSYLRELIRYRRVLRQRNELLQKSRTKPARKLVEVIRPWNHELALLGAKITHQRNRFTENFSGYVGPAYAKLQQSGEEPTMTYRAFDRIEKDGDEQSVVESFHKKLEEMFEKERQRGLTLIGPHRDNFVFNINDLSVRRYASQGQHRTLGIALKIAQLFFLKDVLEESPILLLDDVFDHLDPTRSLSVINLLKSGLVGQTLITDTDSRLYESNIFFDNERHKLFLVNDARVKRWASDQRSNNN